MIPRNASFPLIFLALILLITTAAAAQTGAREEASTALLEDASWYAAQIGVELGEAASRLQVQQELGEVDAQLRTEMADTFAGLWIEHDPEYRVIALFTEESSREPINEMLAAKVPVDLIDLRPAERSLADLEATHALVRHVGKSQAVAFDSEINLKENRIDIFAIETARLYSGLRSTGLALPSGVEVIGVSSLLQTEQAALNGGQALSSCTGGFTVRSTANGELGLSTAAHCGNTQFALGTSLPYRGQDISGNQDVQWHSACDLFDVSNNFNSGIGQRACTGTQHRNNQAVGSFVCKFGMTTGRTCGFIESTSVAPSSAVTSSQSTFVRVGNGGADLSAGGDSGGPWFVENLAYGIHHAGYNSGPHNGDSVYMPINYISSLGVAVLTADPGACNLLPSAVFSHVVFGDTVSFDASGSSDPDGNIVSYTWNFGDGSSTTTTNPMINHFYSNQASYPVTLTVTDNQGGIRSTVRVISLCGFFRICPL